MTRNAETNNRLHVATRQRKAIRAKLAAKKHHEFHNDYEQRVRDLEAEGCTRSDAQAIVDAQQL